ncbi:hypothetical protein FRC19_011749 [Serendipita sp. 401]|nr:hypothetical protein FRC19_011749 [Serendipita sp. 401]
MLEAAPFMKYENWFAEQGLLNEYWLRDATFYPYIFNGQLDMKRGLPEVWKALKHDMRIIHYTWTKPWRCDKEVDQPADRRAWLKEWDEMVKMRIEQGLSLPDHLLNLSTTQYCQWTYVE